MGKAEAVRLALDAIVGAVLAPSCVGCACTLDAPLAGPVCPVCRDDVSRSRGRYDGALRGLIHAFKYEGRRTLGPLLGAAMRGSASHVLDDASCTIPVPLHPWRRFTRGFNQAEDLARHLELPVVHALWRIRATAPQAGLSATQRQRNVRGAFMLSPLLSRRARQQYMEDRIVVLVDDVRTTGATLAACAGLLEGAGVAEIRTLTLAQAPLKGGRT